MQRYMKVMVPIDFTTDSYEAAKMAVEATAPGGRVDLVHVLPQAMTARSSVVEPPAVIDADEAFQRELGQMAQRLVTIDDTVSIGTCLLNGIPAKALVTASEGYDLVVMAIRQRGRISRFILGSVADEVLRETECPVLVVRGRQTADR